MNSRSGCIVYTAKRRQFRGKGGLSAVAEQKNRKASFIEIMKKQILSGERKPGDRLPPERELAAQLGFSRGSVNQGMLDLARMGFLRIVPRKGAFVAEYV